MVSHSLCTTNSGKRKTHYHTVLYHAYYVMNQDGVVMKDICAICERCSSSDGETDRRDSYVLLEWTNQ